MKAGDVVMDADKVEDIQENGVELLADLLIAYLNQQVEDHGGKLPSYYTADGPVFL